MNDGLKNNTHVQLKIIKISVWKFDMFVQLHDERIDKGKWAKIQLILGTKDFQW